jgi:hypothetical protein
VPYHPNEWDGGDEQEQWDHHFSFPILDTEKNRDPKKHKENDHGCRKLGVKDI